VWVLPSEAPEVGKALTSIVVHPAESYSSILPSLPWNIPSSLLLYLAIFGLFSNVGLLGAALMGEMVLGMLFRLGFPGAFYQQGLLLVYFASLYWIALESPHARSCRWCSAGPLFAKVKLGLCWLGLYGAFTIILLESVYQAKDRVVQDICFEESSNQAFGSFLKSAGENGRALILPEPDYLVESLPYYANNPIYLPREGRIGTTVRFWQQAVTLSLSDLLLAGRRVQRDYGRPVLIVLGHSLHGDSAKVRFSYDKVFSWTARECLEFEKATTFVRNFRAATSDENFDVYRLK
jgi:hypothetical protein